ncbi:malonyl CoA-acyl carrier protein transacylase [Corallococcus coralloides DSM 2259]|uniref:Malonyl CoA-acyl carrier protein transacylase n=1 Tax=Corallococcus coralloides (strain ATCC 25202 / DSM 2259 / NBRC 100086 / M2) TaxID=1144275 RepID=H8MRC7_CORCM|nr:SDR family NAD(P)-dependent oxidoreductase [Corallococcus coralloides]AFE09963.1 malonyl CoA-acyl carrier protein transacylase [Corallococcus coralloides DSM 2259]
MNVLAKSSAPAQPPSPNPPAQERYWRAREACPRSIPIDAFYRQVRELNIDFGRSFQAVTRLWKGHYEAIGRIELDAALPADRDPYLLHPVFLDACLQIFGATLYEDPHRKTFIPVGMESFRFTRKPLRVAWSHVKIRVPVQAEDTATVADITFFDDAFECIGGIQGFSLLLGDESSFTEVSAAGIRRAMYQVAWQPQPLKDDSAEAAEGNLRGAWLLMGDTEAPAAALAALLRQRGAQAEWCHVGQGAPSAEVGRILRAFHARHGEAFAGVIQLFLEGEAEAADLARTRADALRASLEAIQALLALEMKGRPRVAWVTRAAQGVEAGEGVQPFLAPLWGLGRVVAREQPSLDCVCLDVDVADPDTVARLVGLELASGDGEEQVAWRHGQRYTARLEPLALAHAANALPGGPFRLGIQEYGSFDHLRLESLTRSEPKPDEVEIAVKATGLNFKDVLHALGMLRVEGQQSGVESAEEMLFGGDCAGEVLRVGAEVRHLAAGDRVAAAMAFGCFGSHVNVPARFVEKLPPSMSFVEGATLPTAFVTACHALLTCARLQPGERVLIHAGAGGVGLAAIQVALMVGARVVATASPSKQAYLLEQGVEQVLNSRTLDFAAALSPAAERGVDVVLNSLSGDFIPRSFEVLREGGRFVEIGKLGILSEAQAHALRPDARYFAFDLMDVAVSEPERITGHMAAVIEWLAAGRLRPVPAEVFPMQRVADAFRHMAQARHKGKIVVTQDRDAASAVQMRFAPDRTYLITGGLGALGLDLAGWLVRRGARRLALVSRRTPGPVEQRALALLEEQGARVELHATDVSDTAAVARLIARLDEGTAPLAGVFHAAGVLADAVIPNQDWKQFETVLSPKVQGAWNLHRAVGGRKLDCFVLFSSIAGVLGSPGQSNYGAANAFLDQLAHHRRQAGLAGLSVAWGLWAGSGMAAQLREQDLERYASSGLRMLDRIEAFHALELLMSQDVGQAVVLPVDWEAFCRQFPGGNVPSFYARVRTGAQVRTEAGQLASRLRAAAPEERFALLCEDLKALVGTVLRAAPEGLDEQSTVRDLGIDSLMGVELRNGLERRLGVSVPAALLLRGPSLAELAQSCLSLLGLAAPEAEAPRDSGTSRWFQSRERAAPPDLRLICFHPLGGGASLFRDWADALPENVQVVAVQLPGREERIDEAGPVHFDALIESLVPRILPLLDRRFAFFGHSMGTLVAFELARELKRLHGLAPEHLVVSGLWAPIDHHLKKDRDSLAEDDYRNLEIAPSLRADASFMRSIMGVMKSDAELLRDYRWKEDPGFSVPILALSGESDPIASADEVRQWRLCTRGGFAHQALPGRHMFFLEQRSRVLELLLKTLRGEPLSS